VDDDELSHLLEDSALERSGTGAATAFINLHRAAPVLLLDAFPQALVGDGTRPPHVIVVGDDRVAIALATLVVRHWWTTARTGAQESRRLPRLTLVDADAARCAKDLLARHPQTAAACELVTVESDVAGSDVTGLALDTAAHAPPFVFVCIPNEAGTLRAALRLRRLVPPDSEIVAATSGEEGVSSLLDVLPQSGDVRMVTIPLLDRACQPEVILNSRNELLARALHENYVEDRHRDGTYHPDRMPSHKPWHDLDDTYRDANRAQAERHVDRLGVVGYSVRSTEDWDPPLPAFTAEEVETMAVREHESWCDDRRHAGWRYGPARDDSRKLHPDLVPWRDLQEGKRELDREPVRELPALLARHGFVVLRQE
jgi:hypothetical protein